MTTDFRTWDADLVCGIVEVGSTKFIRMIILC